MMKITATCVSILSLSLLMGILAPCPSAALDSKITKHLSDSGAVVIIEPDRDTYSTVMSSTVGIGMTPKITSTTKAANVRFHWRTTHGTFVMWGSPGTQDSKVRELEAIPTTKNGEKIYWSFAIAPKACDMAAAGASTILPEATSPWPSSSSETQI